MSHQLNEGHILGLGIPLLDIIAEVDPQFLHKYELNANDVIRASEHHRDLCVDLQQNYPTKCIAGGAVQNSMRVAQWFFHQPRRTTFMGGVGQDELGAQMRLKAEEDRVIVSYYVDPVVPTGTCACLLTDKGKNRSLCAYFGASEKFNLTYLQDNFHLVQQAKILYVSGFHLMACFETSFCLAQHAHQFDDKLFVFNLSAVYVSQKCGPQLNQIMPYVDLLFGNEAEAIAFANMKGWNTNSLEEITQLLANLEHKRPRTVVITQGADDLLVSISDDAKTLRRFKVDTLPEESIVCTNGCGDALVGAFLAYKAVGKSLEQCIEAGIFAAGQVIQMMGCQFPSDNKYRV